MKFRLSKKVVTLLVSLLTFLAMSSAASACYWGVYQPVEPKSLREE